jgi:hypothetical protein
MPSLGQKVDLLFKKYIALKGTVNAVGSSVASLSSPSVAYHQEYFSSKQTISAEQIWTQSKYLPALSNPLNKTPGINASLRVSGQAGSLYSDALNTTNANSPVLVVDGRPILQRVDLQLNPVAGAPFTWAFATQGTSYAIGAADWVGVFGPVNTFKGYNVVPFSYDPSGTLYRYKLYSTKAAAVGDGLWGTSYTLGGEISFLDPSEWFFDPDALVLNFMSEVLPNGVSSGAPLFIRAYRYVGAVGEFGSGEGGALSATTGYLENASAPADLDTVLPPGSTATVGLHNPKSTVYVHVQSSFAHVDGPGGNFTAGQMLRYDDIVNKWTVFTPTNGLRLLVRVEDVPNTPTYTPGPPPVAVAADTVGVNNVVEYWNSSVRGTGVDGFVKLYPTSGQRMAISSDANRIWVFDSTQWIEENSSSNKGSVTNKDMVAKSTGTVVTGTTTTTTTYNIQGVDIGLAEVASGHGYVEVQVNGVTAMLGNGYDPNVLPACCFGKKLPSYSVAMTGSTAVLTFLSAHNMVTNDQLAYITSDGVVHVPTVTQISPTSVSVPVADIPTGSPTAFAVRRYSSIALGDLLVWFGANAKYELDPADRVSYIYVSAS